MELWTLQEVAKRTSTSVGFWRKQVLQQRIPVIRVGRLVRLSPDDVRSYLAARTRPAKEATSGRSGKRFVRLNRCLKPRS